VPKKRKYPCCIRILRERTKNRGQVPLVLLVKGRQVEASQKHMALLACLHENQGHIVSYKQLGLILGTNLLKRRSNCISCGSMYCGSVKRWPHKALCMLAVAPRVGYVLCGHK
jgi:hypothetical protein